MIWLYFYNDRRIVFLCNRIIPIKQGLLMTTYDKILHQANILIQQRGFLGFSYADLEKRIGIRKASIHHYFPSKIDLGLAYCQYKKEGFIRLEGSLYNIPSGLQRLKTYLNAFSDCAKKGEMCGVYAMLSDSHQFPLELQEAVNLLADFELNILKNILIFGQENGDIRLFSAANELAVIVCSSLKGALMLNRIPPHNAYFETVKVLLTMLDSKQ